MTIDIKLKKLEQELKSLVRNPITVPNVRKALVEIHYLLNISEFTLERDPINVVNVGKPLD